MYFLLKIVIFHCYVSLPEGIFIIIIIITINLKNTLEVQPPVLYRLVYEFHHFLLRKGLDAVAPFLNSWQRLPGYSGVAIYIWIYISLTYWHLGGW